MMRTMVVALCAITTSVVRAQGTRPMPLVVDPRAPVAARRLASYTMFDSSYQRPRRIWVYTPAGYDAKGPAYPLIVAFDGAEYRDTMPLPWILDTLRATRKAPAFVAVLVDNSEGAERIADLGNAQRMAKFMSAQLIPWVRQRWHVTTDPQRTIVTGSSAGGLGSAFVALEHPELFGNVLSQSGAFWRGPEASNDAPYEWLTTRVKERPRSAVTFFVDVGELEDHATLGGSGPNFRDANRRFVTALRAKGFQVEYTEVPGGMHAEPYWMQRLPVGIVSLTSKWK